MRINLTSVLVDDQEKALRFYADVLGFVPKHDIPLGGEHRADSPHPHTVAVVHLKLPRPRPPGRRRCDGGVGSG